MSLTDGIPPYTYTRRTNQEGVIEDSSNTKRIWASVVNDLQVGVEDLSQAAARRVFDVKTYGAKGDGTTDDTVAIHAARTAAGVGGRVYVPPGTYIVTGLTLSVASQEWILAPGATIKLKNASNADVIDITASDVTIRGGTIDGNKANQTTAGAGIVAVAVDRPTIQCVRVTATYGQGIYIFQGSDPLIDACRVDAAGKTATIASQGASIYLNTTTRGRVRGCIVESGNDSGISLGGSAAGNEISITGNSVRNCNFIGIALGGGHSTHVAVVSNTVEDCGGNGIDTGNAQWVSVTGNVIYNCNGGIINDPGSFAGDDLYVVVMGNTVHTTTNALGTSGNGIALVGGCVIAGNYVELAALDGIAVYSGGFAAQTGHTIVANNICRGNGTSGAGYAGIGLYSADASHPLRHITINGNRCYDDKGTQTQSYGVRFLAAAGGIIDHVTMVGNDLVGNLTGALNPQAGAGAVPVSALIKANDGYNDQSATAVATLASGTVATAGLDISRVAPAAARTGIILEAGLFPRQEVTVINESVAANTLTFAASGTSHVADGTSDVIAGLTSARFVWDSGTSLWYRVK